MNRTFISALAAMMLCIPATAENSQDTVPADENNLEQKEEKKAKKNVS